MNLDNLSGQSVMANPVKIAVIDSGIFASHEDLSPNDGFDFGETTEPTKNWKKDGSGHGTHVAGICAAHNNVLGILGFAPKSELVVLRVFPNASNAKLIDALDWCIDNDVDVINMSLGGKNPSQLVQQRLQACRENGILPIAAAGNNGGDVLFPAAFEEALSVAAIGSFDTFPQDSSHQRHIGENPITSGDYFSPKFTCRGPEVDVCAPGVAIVSTVPENGYAAWDGTSMASPHVAGLATRLLQIRNDIWSLPRTLERSQSLFDAILDTCEFLDGIPSIFQGKGMPRLIVESTSNTNATNIQYLDKVSELVDEAINLIETEIENP
jgi:subtilisin family serine protease